MGSNFWAWIRGSQKAITALVISGAAYLVTRYQLHLPVGWETALAGLVTALFVYMVPNKKPA
jgi:hypothetical protein